MGRSLWYSHLCVLYGCLCMFEGTFQSELGNFQNDVLMMEEYGVKDSWTKLFTIRGTLVPITPSISSHNVLVFSWHNVLYTYDLKKKGFTRTKRPPPDLLKIKSVLSGEGHNKRPVSLKMHIGPFMYTESLAFVDLI
ncbi:OLC1v1029318C1 [Oldenlandia corymbosa var. corymbosa]|uniref:OLC1v1029318C1 n=1 Tax=Oldenlandia corymbosa var. corymbosa TaxID=529605 RepID=A0AAV1CEA0_OLDCO|nr:OLC1v1029318C1 [Oldenlandia corymbosa var. corymbosa]